MNSINFSKEELSLCHKNNCVNVRGEVAKAIAFGLATLVVISGIASMLEQSSWKLVVAILYCCIATTTILHG